MLIILDGYGVAKDATDNAVTQSKSPFLHQLMQTDFITLEAASQAVGLPPNTIGNSEVGHFTIGCGQILKQSLLRINEAIADQSFFDIPLLLDQIKKAQNIHITCLLSDTGIHGQIEHLEAICKLLKKHHIQNFYFHAVLDGRDVPQKSAQKYLDYVQKLFLNQQIGTLASICGRYYAMDRDQNFERTEVFYNLLTNSQDYPIHNLSNILDTVYQEAENDYYSKAYKIHDFQVLSNQDLFINLNFRTDRQEQITQALEDLDFQHFKAPIKPHLITFGDYGSKKFNIFPTPKIQDNLATVLDQNHFKQARIAETEKYAHVTYFFNSQNKHQSKFEDRFLIPSSKVANFKDQPEMQAEQITTKAIQILNQDYKLIVINYANPDLVGHSGNLEATKTGIDCVDQNLASLVPQALKEDYTILITADHGNAEDMEHANHVPNPSHTTNLVPFILISNQDFKLKTNQVFGLKDIAPTILDILDLKAPDSFQGQSMLKK